MQRTLRFLLLALLFAVGGAAHAQQEALECVTPDCSAGWFYETIIFDYLGRQPGEPGYLDCHFEVKYAHKNCDPFFAFQVLEITWYDGSCMIPPFQITTALRQWIWEQIVFLDKHNYLKDDCAAQYEMSQSTCWRDEVYSGYYTRSLPCNNICCSRKYAVCEDENGNITMTATGPSPWGWATCAESDPGEGCVERCQGQFPDVIEIDPDDRDYPLDEAKRSVPPGIRPELQAVSLNASAHPNPASSHVSIDIAVEVVETLTINVYAADGKLVTSQLQEISSAGITTVTLDVERLAPARYYVDVTQREKSIAHTSFQVKK